MKRILKKYNPVGIAKKLLADKNKTFKRGLLLLILMPFLFIHLQQFRPYVSLKSLKGYFIPKTYVPMTTAGWFSGEYQHTTDDYINEAFGFRNFLVRLHNEIRFLLFRKTSADGVIIGKQNYLYEYGYILAYKGREFMGEQALNDTVAKIKLLQDTLETFGKKLLIMLAPSKPRIYPEFLPDSITPEAGQFTNYGYYSKRFEEAGVNYIDFMNIFRNKKSQSKYLLFPQLGVHWSRLEAVRAADTMINYLAIKSETDLPRIKITSIIEKDTLEAPDNDIVGSMNLLWYPPYKKMSYPTIEIEDKKKAKRNIIVIADSYWWDIYLREIPKKAFEYNEFWYYNKELWGNNYLGKTDPKTIDIKRHILQSDYIVIVCTESNLSRLGFGFFGQAMAAMRRAIKPTANELKDIKTVIANEKDWFDQIQKKAVQRGLSTDSMLTLDALWYFQRKGPLKKEISLEDVKESIRVNEGWMKEIVKKAEERKISVDSMMTEDALWFMQNNLKNTELKKKETLTLEIVKDRILHNYEWMEQIREKSKKRGIPVDSMIMMDARWYLEQEKN